MSRVPLTKEGEISIKEKLSHLKFVERPQISQAIAEARAHGDLKENAEYHAAKELQGLIEAKINAMAMIIYSFIVSLILSEPAHILSRNAIWIINQS